MPDPQELMSCRTLLLGWIMWGNFQTNWLFFLSACLIGAELLAEPVPGTPRTSEEFLQAFCAAHGHSPASAAQAFLLLNVSWRQHMSALQEVGAKTEVKGKIIWLQKMLKSRYSFFPTCMNFLTIPHISIVIYSLVPRHPLSYLAVVLWQIILMISW